MFVTESGSMILFQPRRLECGRIPEDVDVLDDFALWLLFYFPVEIIANASEVVLKADLSSKNFAAREFIVKNKYCIVVNQSNLLVDVSLLFELLKLLWNVNNLLWFEAFEWNFFLNFCRNEADIFIPTFFKRIKTVVGASKYDIRTN